MKKFFRIYITLCLLVGCFFSYSCQEIQSEVVTENYSEYDWMRIGPGGGGSSFLPTISPHDSNEIAVKCDMTGAYFSKDAGAVFNMVNFAGGVSSFAYDPINKDAIYVGASALHKSEDGGKSWQSIFPKPLEIIDSIYKDDHADFYYKIESKSLYPKGNDIVSVKNITINSLNNNELCFSIDNLLYFSTDTGLSWQTKGFSAAIQAIYSFKNAFLVFTETEQFYFNIENKTVETKAYPKEMQPAFSFAFGETKVNGNPVLYALHDTKKEGEFGLSEVWQSLDNGQSWHKLNLPILTNTKNNYLPSFSKIATAQFDGDYAYLVCDRYLEKKANGNIGHWYGVLKTADGGKNWDWVLKAGGGSSDYTVKDGQEANNISDAWVKEAFSGEFIRFLEVGVAPKNGKNAVVTDWYRVLNTNDGGQHWEQKYSTKQEDNSYISNGFDVTTSYGVHLDPFDKNHLAVSYTDIGYHHSYNGGKSWKRSVEGVPAAWDNTCYWMVFDPEVKGKVWSVWSSLHDFPRGKMTRNPNWKDNAKGGVCISENGGQSWKPSSNGLGDNSPATSIVLDLNSPINNRTLYTSVYSKGVFKSTDNGESWVLKNNGIIDNSSFWQLNQQGNDLYLVMTPSPNHEEGKVVNQVNWGALYHSNDGAENWQRIELPKGIKFPNHIKIDPTNENRLLLSSWSDIVLADFIGRKAANLNGGNTEYDLDGGLWISEDKGKSWTCIYDKDVYVYASDINKNNTDHLLINTFNHSALQSFNSGKSWKKLEGYDFKSGHRAIFDPNGNNKVYLTTFGGGVWEGKMKIKK